jgi:DMSO/TMAO reductase YedYZ molybdopterin-dependent catalytic subunit
MGLMTDRAAAKSGFAWGAIGGLALVALMYLASGFLGLRPLTQALNEPLLSIMPGFVFGFLIDTLQHVGKVVEEAGLIVAMVVALGVLGAAWALVTRRRQFRYSALVFAGIGWLVVVLVLLPIAGVGFLGLNDGFATPIEWAVLFVAYGMVLEASVTPASGEVDLQRRSLLGAIPIGIGAAALGLTGLLRVPSWYQAIANPAGAGLSGPSPAITPTGDFYIVSKNLAGDPVVDATSWRLSIGGLVDKPLKLTISDLRALPSTTEIVTLECISNDVGGPQISTGAFTGVRMSDLIGMASPQSAGLWAAFKSVDGYAESLPIGLIDGQGSIMVAYDLNGAPLPTGHGFPARVLVPGHYGMKGPKWLQSIDVVPGESGGFWEQQGWDHNAVVKTMSRFDVPRDGAIYKLGTISLYGVAFAGTRGITKVEFSTDGGRSWSNATLQPPLSPLSWVLWSATWTPGSEGSYTLVVRATDGSGALQTSANAASFPSGSSGYHTVRIDISK